MFKIGDFSKLSRVPVKTLRYYDEIGLLKPVGVDRFTRYRYYSVDQLPNLYRILGLKELGFTLEQISRLLEGDLSPEQLTRMLQVRHAELLRQMEQDRMLVQRIETRLKEIEQEGKMPDYEIVLKKVEPVWIASIRGVIPSYDQSEPIFDRLFDEVYGYVHQNGVRNPGCGLAIYHDPNGQGDNIEVEAAAQLPTPLKGSNRVTVYELPGVDQVASVVHHGPFVTIGKAYAAILGWIQANDFRICGPARELYLAYQRLDQNHNVTEIQFPVEKLRLSKASKQPKIIPLESFLVVGMPYLGKNEQGEIGQLWQAFIPRIPEIRHIAPGPEVSYGICSPSPAGLVDYIAALPVARLADIPEGMVGKEVPAQTYVMFAAYGLDDIGATYRLIQKEWLPDSGYQPGDGPDFELYPESFEAEDPQSVIEIYFPIKKA